MFTLCEAQHQRVYSKANIRIFGPKWPTPPVDLSVGDIAAEWLQIAQRSQWRAYRKPPSLFRMVPSLTPYDLPFPKNGVPYAPRYANGHISATDDPVQVMFGFTVGFSRSADQMALFPVTLNQTWRQAAILDNFWIATSPQRLIRSTYIVCIAWSSLRQHSFLVADDIKCITCLFFNAVCTLWFVIGLIGPTVWLNAGDLRSQSF